MTDRGESIQFYADYVSPVCYLVRQWLDRYRGADDASLAIEWHPFNCRADRREQDGELDSTTTQEPPARERTSELGDQFQAADDVEMAPEAALTVDALPAQRASIGVRMQHPEAWASFDVAVYEALWVDGRDIGRVGVLADIGDAVGIEPSTIRAAVDDALVARRLEDLFEAARARGVTSVPTLVSGNRVLRAPVTSGDLRRFVEGD